MRNLIAKLGVALVLSVGLGSVGCGGGGGGGGTQDSVVGDEVQSLSLGGKVAMFMFETKDLQDEWDGYDTFLQIVTCYVPELNLSLEVTSRKAKDPYSSNAYDPDRVVILPVVRANRLFVERKEWSSDYQSTSSTYTEYRYNATTRAFDFVSNVSSLPSKINTTTSWSSIGLSSAGKSATAYYTSQTGNVSATADEQAGQILVCVTENYSTKYTTYYGASRAAILLGGWSTPFTLVVPSQTTKGNNLTAMIMP